MKITQTGGKAALNPPPDWAKILVNNTNIKPAMKRILAECYGDKLTLGELSMLPWSEILSLPGAGRVAADSCVAAISRAIRGERKPIGPTLFDMASK